MGRFMLVRDDEEEDKERDDDQEKAAFEVKSASETADDGEDDDPPRPTTTISSTSTSFSPPSTRLSSTSTSLSPKPTSVSSSPTTLSTTSTRVSTTALAASSSITKSTVTSTPLSITSSQPAVVVAASSTSSSLKSTGAAIADTENGTPPSVTQHTVVSNTLIVFGSLGIVAIIVLLVAVLVVLKKKKNTNGSNNSVDNENQPRNPAPQESAQAFYMPPHRTVESDDTSFVGRGKMATPLTLNPSTAPFARAEQTHRSISTAAPMASGDAQRSTSTSPSDFTDNKRASVRLNPFADPSSGDASNAEHGGPFGDARTPENSHWSSTTTTRSTQVASYHTRNLQASSVPVGSSHAVDPLAEAERRHLEDQRKRTLAALAGRVSNSEQRRT